MAQIFSMNKFKHLATSCLLAMSAGSGFAQEELSETGVFLDGVAAIVNEGVVLKSELDRQQDVLIQRALQADANIELPPAHILREQILERLIIEEIQMQRAERIGIQVSDQMLNTAIGQIAENAGFTFDQMPAILARDGVTYAEYREDTRKQMILEQLRRIDVVNRISVSPREVEQCVADLEDNAVVNSSYNLSHIFISVPPNATNSQFAEAEAEARDVYDQLIAGANFAELAIRHSDGDTALEGGALGWRPGDQLPTLFFDVVGEMQSGDVSEPIRAVSGYHIVKINEMQGVNQQSTIEQTRIRHILITPDEIIDEETAQQRLEDALEDIRDGEPFGEVAKLLSDDPSSANTGGEMDWTGPGEFVPEFEEVANSLEIGVISEPFRSRFGWHILEVLERRTYDNTEDLKESNCVQRVRNGKLNNETELWARRIRDEAFVEIRI
jgi:peptidyl-prolyl cis-trans isomerase SurA